jgi:hypothetical protein
VIDDDQASAGLRDEVYLLADVCIHETLSAEMAARLEELVCNDPVARQHYVYFLHDAYRLHHLAAMASATCNDPDVESWIDNEGAFADIVSGNPHLTAPPVNFFGLPRRGTGSFLVDHPWVFSYLVATVLVGVAALVASYVHVTHYRQQGPTGNIARQSPTSIKERNLESAIVSVARVTDMIDCTWADQGFAPSMQRILLGDKFALASGMMEITYDTGARVVLQGPCTYRVDSRTGGFLSLGKLTARVEKRGEGPAARGQGTASPKSPVPSEQISSSSPLPASHPADPSPLAAGPSPLFTVRTPTAVVNDLGTEFGVEVDENSGSCAHVFAGMVDFAPAGKPSDGVRISTGNAGQIFGNSGAVVKKIAFDGSRFAVSRAMLARTFRRDQVLFRDTFEAFVLGVRWRAGSMGSPGVLNPVSHDGRSALRMKNEPAESPVVRTIETIDSFSLQNLAVIQLDVVFTLSKTASPRIETRLLGSSKKLVRMVTSASCVTFSTDVCEPIHQQLGASHSPRGVCRSGERVRSILTIDRQCTRLTIKDDVNGAVVHKDQFDNFSLADLGDDVRVVLVLFTEPNRAGECWIYEATVCGRLSATHYPSSKDVPRHTSNSTVATPLVASH